MLRQLLLVQNELFTKARGPAGEYVVRVVLKVVDTGMVTLSSGAKGDAKRTRDAKSTRTKKVRQRTMVQLVYGGCNLL